MSGMPLAPRILSPIQGPRRFTLEIRVVSSLTPEDEGRYAATFLKLIAAVLDTLSVAYAIHVELADGSIVRHGHGQASTLVPDRDQFGRPRERQARGGAD